MEKGLRNIGAMGLLPPQSASQDDKPLPSLAVPASPTLTNPDMVLPDHLWDTASVSSLSHAVRPPSLSYLVKQHQQERSDNRQAARKNDQRSRTPSGTEPVLQTSPARRVQYRYSDAAIGSSPTVGNITTDGYSRGRLGDDSKRLSMAASSINSEDLDEIRMPEFAGIENDDTETLDDLDLDMGTPNETWHADEPSAPLDAEQSAMTLMRAELILANAKKRLNVMDQNLRGAREIVAPLTAANLKRATSLSSAYIQPVHFGRARYITREHPDARVRYPTDRPQPGDGYGHYRVFSDPVPSPTLTERIHIPSSRAAIPVSKFSPSWTSNPLRGSKSQEQIQGGRMTPRPLHAVSPEPKLEPLLEHDPSREENRSLRVITRQPSTATGLREQMHELKERISSLKDRARDDSMRRRSMQSLRQSCPLVNSGQPDLKPVSSGATIGRSPAILPGSPSPPLTEDGDSLFDHHLAHATVPRPSANAITRESPNENIYTLDYEEDRSVGEDTATSLTRSSGSSGSTDETVTDTSEEAEEDDVFADAPDILTRPQRHEDREDAFDYANLFLHSSMGTFSRPRGSSVSSVTSTDSEQTARGPCLFDQVPPTPETPETLREIERSIHTRAVSTESIATISSFATAQEDIRSGRRTPIAMSEWLSKDQSTVHVCDRADSSMSVAETSTSKGGALRSRSSTQTSLHATFPPIKPSPVSAAVSALLDAKSGPLSLKDKTLLFAVVDSLKRVCEKLQADDEDEGTSSLLRKKLADARQILTGSTDVVV